MPVEGFPDPARHKLCWRCKKWHEPSEGVVAKPKESVSFEPFLGAFGALRSLCGVRPKPHFVCRRCLKIRRYTTIIIFATFGFLVALCLILGRLGVI